MTVPWVVDSEANATLWRALTEMPLRLEARGGRVADLGGGNGNFVSPLLGTGTDLVTVDVNPDALRTAPPGIHTVRGSILALPFRDAAFGGIAGRAVLHHVPVELDRAIKEAVRVLRPGGLALIQEPTDGNAIANFARRRFPTERHDPHERPLSGDAYVAAVRRDLEILEIRYEFLLSYLFPHLVGRIRSRRRRAARGLTRWIFRLDRALLAALPGLRSRAAYVSILARRPGGTPVSSEQP